MMATIFKTKIIIKIVITIIILSSPKKLAHELMPYLSGDLQEDRENMSKVSGVPVSILQ
jgi:hypothetical protein